MELSIFKWKQTNTTVLKESGYGRAQPDLFIKYVAGYPVSQFLEYAEL